MRKSGATLSSLDVGPDTPMIFLYAEAGSVLPENLGANVVLVQE